MSVSKKGRGKLPRTSQRKKGNNVPSESFVFLGATFTDTDKDTLDHNGADHGVLPQQIPDDSPLSGVLDEGSVVSAINQTDINNIQDLKKFAASHKNDKSMTFLTFKDGFSSYRGIER